MSDYLSSPAPLSASMVIQCCGDISLDGPYCDPQHHEVLRKNMAEVAAFLGPADLRIGNWESPLWGDGGMNLLKLPRVSTTLETARCLLPLKLDVVTLANNHAFDCREQGFRNTTEFLDQAGIRWLGAGLTPERAREPLILDRGGVRLGLLNYIGLETNPNLPSDAGIYLNVLEEDRTCVDIRELAKAVDAVIVHLHWASAEMIRMVHPGQRILARRMIEAGATIVFGGHAHCVQGDEACGSGHIYYSLGNFIFGRLPVEPGHAGHDWPADSRKVGVAVCRLGRRRVDSACWRFLVQDEMLLRPDDTYRRRRLQERLSCPLARSDGALRRAFKREILWRKLLLPGLQRVKQSGGLIGALCAIRMRHFRWIGKMLAMRARKGR